MNKKKRRSKLSIHLVSKPNIFALIIVVGKLIALGGDLMNNLKKTCSTMRIL